MTRGRPGPRRWLPSYFRAMRRRCQASRVSGCRDVFPQHTIFFLEIVDDVALLLVDPAGHGDDDTALESAC